MRTHKSFAAALGAGLLTFWGRVRRTVAGGRVRWAIALDPAGQVVMWQVIPAPLEAVAGPQ